MMIAWVLIWGLGYNWGGTIPGIATEQACLELANRLQSEGTIRAASMHCYSYNIKSEEK